MQPDVKANAARFSIVAGRPVSRGMEVSSETPGGRTSLGDPLPEVWRRVQALGEGSTV